MVRIQADTFDPGAEYQALLADAPGIGAICQFVGLVRDFGDRPEVQALEIEHYPGMTEKAMERVIEEARARWSLIRVNVIHRVGRLSAGEVIVLVGVSSAHRADAFAACEFIMDYLKVQAPFWKKELTDQHSAWVEQKGSDQQRAERWSSDNKSD